MPEPTPVVDAHTHIFPPEVAAQRARYQQHDPWFATLYANPRARIATADDLIATMDRAGVTTSWALAFGWHDTGLGREHNAYLLDAAARFPGRIVPFAHVPPDADDPDLDGFAGIGEWMPEGQGFTLDEHQRLARQLAAADARGLPVLTHVSEPIGHDYPGKSVVSPASMWRLARAFPRNRFVAAHWGGGLLFYELMPEVRQDLANVWYDTGAGRLLYDIAVFQVALQLVPAAKVLWGSDYPVLSPRLYLRALKKLGLPEAALRGVLGENSRALVRQGAISPSGHT